jgi:hypothetical protein
MTKGFLSRILICLTIRHILLWVSLPSNNDHAQQTELDGNHDKSIRNIRFRVLFKGSTKDRIDDKDKGQLLGPFQMLLVFLVEGHRGRTTLFQELTKDDRNDDTDGQFVKDFLQLRISRHSQISQNQYRTEKDPGHVSKRGIENGRSFFPPRRFGQDQDHIDRLRARMCKRPCRRPTLAK